RDARGADLAVDVGTRVGIAPIERHAVESGREAGRLLAFAEQVEAAVGALGAALAGEHAGRVFLLALEREDARGEGEAARQILLAQVAHARAPVRVRRERHLRDRRARERGPEVRDLVRALAHRVLLRLGAVALRQRGPALELGPQRGVELGQGALA